MLTSSNEWRNKLVEALTKADFGIADARLRKIEPSEDEPKYKQFRELLDKAMASIFDEKHPYWKTREESPEAEFPELIHRGSNGVTIPMDFHFEESMGTRRFSEVMAACVKEGEKGRLLIVDELEASLHPILVRELISVFTNLPASESLTSQIFFTTHNPLLLDQTLLRRDQIWFTEKDQEGATRLYPLTDFKPRKDESLVKGYLAGRYGGIPFIPEGLKF